MVQGLLKTLKTRVLILTAARGIGKTTVLIKTVDTLKAKGVSVCRMISREVRKDSELLGFEILDLTSC
jgi:nucleoside-triphosphatase THEP1